MEIVIIIAAVLLVGFVCLLAAYAADAIISDAPGKTFEEFLESLDLKNNPELIDVLCGTQTDEQI